MKAIDLRVAFSTLIFAVAASSAAPPSPPYVANDGHVHLTNYIQEGPDIHDFLRVMGDKIGRATLFGIPLQQTWSYRISGSNAPTYYLDTDAPLYYYSFTDAQISIRRRSLAIRNRLGAFRLATTVWPMFTRRSRITPFTGDRIVVFPDLGHRYGALP